MQANKIKDKVHERDTGNDIIETLDYNKKTGLIIASASEFFIIYNINE